MQNGLVYFRLAFPEREDETLRAGFFACTPPFAFFRCFRCTLVLLEFVMSSSESDAANSPAFFSLAFRFFLVPPSLSEDTLRQKSIMINLIKKIYF